MRRAVAVLFAAMLGLMLIAGPALAAKGGVKGSPIAPDAIYADGQLWGTIGQGPLHYNGNDQSFDKLFLVPGQMPVSEAGPGNSDYNGGRWLPVPVTWNSAPYLLTSYSEVRAAALVGDITLGAPNTGGTFLCPLIRNA